MKSYYATAHTKRGCMCSSCAKIEAEVLSLKDFPQCIMQSIMLKMRQIAQFFVAVMPGAFMLM